MNLRPPLISCVMRLHRCSSRKTCSRSCSPRRRTRTRSTSIPVPVSGVQELLVVGHPRAFLVLCNAASGRWLRPSVQPPILSLQAGRRLTFTSTGPCAMSVLWFIVRPFPAQGRLIFVMHLDSSFAVQPFPSNCVAALTGVSRMRKHPLNIFSVQNAPLIAVRKHFPGAGGRTASFFPAQRLLLLCNRLAASPHVRGSQVRFVVFVHAVSFLP